MKPALLYFFCITLAIIPVISNLTVDQAAEDLKKNISELTNKLNLNITPLKTQSKEFLNLLLKSTGYGVSKVSLRQEESPSAASVTKAVLEFKGFLNNTLTKKI